MTLAEQRYHKVAAQQWGAIHKCGKCHRMFRTYGGAAYLCQSCTPSSPWIPPGSNQLDYGGW
jgi:hypothetical protein